MCACFDIIFVKMPPFIPLIFDYLRGCLLWHGGINPFQHFWVFLGRGCTDEVISYALMLELKMIPNVILDFSQS